MSLQLRTSHHGANSSSRLEKPRARNVVSYGLRLSKNSIHSNDEDNAQEQGYNIKTC